MKHLLILYLILSGCSQSIYFDSTSLVNVLVNDIVNDGVSVFHWQRTQHGKQSWDLFLADRLLSVEEINVLMGHNVIIRDSQTSAEWGALNKEIDFSDLKVPNVTLSPMNISDTTNLKTGVLPTLKSLQREGLLILSTPFIDKDLQGSNQFRVLSIYYWDNNTVKVLYNLEMKNKAFHILEREVLS